MGALGWFSAAFYLPSPEVAKSDRTDCREAQLSTAPKFTHILLILNDLLIRASGYPPGSKSL
jgi:hypothetical protein